MNILADFAKHNGIAGFTAFVLVDNHGMLRIFHKCGYGVESKLEDGVYSLLIPFVKSRSSHPERRNGHRR